jgi:hypothetical protein
VLGVSRAGLHRTEASERRRPVADQPWTERVRQLIHQYPTFGYRAVGAVAIPGRTPHQSKDRLSYAEAERVVRASTRLHPTPPCEGLGESGQSE